VIIRRVRGAPALFAPSGADILRRSGFAHSNGEGAGNCNLKATFRISLFFKKEKLFFFKKSALGVG
jgi:hypothetical protein